MFQETNSVDGNYSNMRIIQAMLKSLPQNYYSGPVDGAHSEKFYDGLKAFGVDEGIFTADFHNTINVDETRPIFIRLQQRVEGPYANLKPLSLLAEVISIEDDLWKMDIPSVEDIPLPTADAQQILDLMTMLWDKFKIPIKMEPIKGTILDDTAVEINFTFPPMLILNMEGAFDDERPASMDRDLKWYVKANTPASFDFSFGAFTGNGFSITLPLPEKTGVQIGIERFAKLSMQWFLDLDKDLEQLHELRGKNPQQFKSKEREIKANIQSFLSRYPQAHHFIGISARILAYKFTNDFMIKFVRKDGFMTDAAARLVKDFLNGTGADQHFFDVGSPESNEFASSSFVQNVIREAIARAKAENGGVLKPKLIKGGKGWGVKDGIVGAFDGVDLIDIVGSFRYEILPIKNRIKVTVYNDTSLTSFAGARILDKMFDDVVTKNITNPRIGPLRTISQEFIFYMNLK